ncbi:MAG: transposase [Bacteroidia bacterium]|nr:transposase [Bacteroidia bacterium]
MMGAKKQWNGKEKLAIVLQGLKCDRSISELCNEHGITQGMYYKWRDQLLTDGAKLFDRGGVDHARERLEIENRRLKETIGELTVELKKNDW